MAWTDCSSYFRTETYDCITMYWSIFSLFTNFPLIFLFITCLNLFVQQYSLMYANEGFKLQKTLYAFCSTVSSTFIWMFRNCGSYKENKLASKWWENCIKLVSFDLQFRTKVIILYSAVKEFCECVNLWIYYCNLVTTNTYYLCLTQAITNWS